MMTLTFYSMMRDVEYFQTKLAKFDGFGDAGDVLANIVKTKEIKPIESVVEKEPEKANEVEPNKEEISTSDSSPKPSEDGGGENEGKKS